MGWLFGIVGKFSEDDEISFGKLPYEPIHKIVSSDYYFAAGGIAETCLCYKSQDNESGFIICGLGIKYENFQFSFMKVKDWERVVFQDEISLINIDGHFTGIKWTGENVTVFTDSLGGRDIYISKMKNYFIISTRLDWIAKLNNNANLLFDELGSRLLMQNQFSNNSILSNTTRLAQGGIAKILIDSTGTPVADDIHYMNNKSFSINLTPWIPEKSISQPVEPDEILKKAAFFPAVEGKKISISLSGGMDSRVLLALFISSEDIDWDAHTFGNINHPDSIIAKKLSEKYHFIFEQFDTIIPSPEDSIKYLREFGCFTLLTSPASEILNKIFYPCVYKENNVIIDGSFGEIGRRSFFNKILYKGRQALIRRDIPEIIKTLRYYNFDFFSPEIISLMEKGIFTELENLFETMPDINKFGVENWLDLLAIRTKYPNYNALEQSRMDCLAVGYTPFASKFFINSVMNSPVNKRKNANYFRQIISNNAPGLSKFPLVKGNTYLPYSFQTLPSKILGKIKQKAGFTYSDPIIQKFLFSLKEYVLDTINSSEVRKCPVYDYKNLQKLAELY